MGHELGSNSADGQSGRFGSLLERSVKPPDEPWAQEAFEAQLPPERMKQLFAPLPTPSNPQQEQAVDPHRFDQMLGLAPADGVAPGQHSPIEAPQPPGQTPAGREAARRQIFQTLAIDAKLREIVEEYKVTLPPDVAITPESLVTAMHTDPRLRVAVGRHFLGKLDMLAHEPGGYNVLPSRVASDTEKRPHKPHPRLATMRSREYVSVLALSMLDGTFDTAQTSDPIEYERAGTGLDFVGQHRYAAELLLRRYHIQPDGTYQMY